jgi:hypothetical protein
MWFPPRYATLLSSSLLRRHRLSIIVENFLQAKKINSGDACQNPNTLDQLCNPCGPSMLTPPPLDLFVHIKTVYYKMSKAVLPLLPWDTTFYIQIQFEKISIENIIFMLQIVTNMNETLIILHLQRMVGI